MIDVPPDATLYGHRCLPGDNENTLSALRKVGRHGACEVDTWRLADGRFVIIHDPTWTRTIDPATMPNDLPDYVGAATWEQVKRLRTKGGEPVPTLARTLRLADKRDVRVIVEVKNHVPSAALLARFPGVSWYRQPVPANGCSVAQVVQLAQAGVRTGVKMHDECPMTKREVAATGATFVAARNSALTKRSVRRWSRLGVTPMPLLAGRESWRRLFNAGVRDLIVPDPRKAEREAS